MTVESATYIGDLNSANPVGSTSPVSELDNHIRLIKAALLASFPSLGSAAMTATAAQLSALPAQVTALYATAGTLSVGTSTTSVAVGTGSKSFTTQTGLGFATGQMVRIQDNASLSNYMIGQISSYVSSSGALVVNVTSSNGSGTIADWSISIVIQPSMTRRAVTGTDTLVSSDWGNLVDVTSGTFILAFSAVATLGNGWFGFVRNAGSGVVTLDPNSSETIDGSSTATMYEGEIRLLQCDGSAIRSMVIREPQGVFHLQDQKTSGTAGQTISATTWTKRDLQTTIRNSITGASVASSVVSLPAGTYRVRGVVSGVSVAATVGISQVRIRNTTDGATLGLAVQTTTTPNSINVPLVLDTEFTISGTKNIEIQHYVTGTGGAVGNAASSGEVETYASIRFERV